MESSNPYAQGIFQAVKQAQSLAQDYNKVSDVKADGLGGGNGDEVLEEYKSKYTPEEARRLRAQWKATYSVYFGDVEPDQKKSYNYWLGKQKTDVTEDLDGHNTVDNLIFEAVETFLPIANRANPDPVVTAGDAPAAIELAKNTKSFLVDWADKAKFRMRLKGGTRQWVMSKLGVWKVSYNVVQHKIECNVLVVKNLKLDPDGHWDEEGLFTGDWIGEPKKISAGTLSDMFPKHADRIKALSKGNATKKLTLEEWWYKGTDVFYFIDDECVGTFKNPNWNYDGETKTIDPNTQEEISTPVQGKNHMFGRNQPTFPYVGLSVFSTGEHPHDDTSLIMQNVSMQDLHNKRLRQIDKNADSQNNGALASGTSFTKEQAAEAATFLRKGGTVWVPNGDVNTAWKRDAAPALPGDIFQQQEKSEERLKGIFGITGSTASGIQDEKSVRGKIMVQQTDSSRIGGGVTEYIEQAANTIYNFVIQFVFVYGDKPFEFNAMGLNGAQEAIQLHNTDFLVDPNVTVKDGSLIPKDPLTERNEAMDLWSAQAIGLPELYSRLDFADPMESAQQTLTWQMVAAGKLPPQVLFPQFGAPMAQGAQQGTVSPQEQQQGTETQPQPLTSPPAVEQQSQQLLQSVPLGGAIPGGQ